MDIFSKYPSTILITSTKMIPTLCSIQLYEDQWQNDLINNYYLILVLNNFLKTKS